MSIWTETVSMPSFAPLKGEKNTDVLVIGGGMAGLLCTDQLCRAGVDCMLLEADTVCSGVTGNTTAKVTAQHGLIYHGLLQKYGVEKAGMYLHANQTALETYRVLCRDIDCDFEEKDAWVYSQTDRKKLEREVFALRTLGVSAELADHTPLPFPVEGAVRFPGQAQFHPLKFAAAIAKRLPIYEHTPVRALAPHRAETDVGTVTARSIIVATHFPMLNKHGGYFLKLYQHRSYVIALENAEKIGGMYVDEAQCGLSFRMWRNLLLLGGGDHRTGKQGGNWEELRAFAKEHYPNARETARWAAQDCMSLDGIPYIGPYSAGAEGLYAATGFNKWGMTSSMAAAIILTDLICGRKNPDAEVFSPSRSVWTPQLAINAGEAAAHLLKPTPPRCPHLGCALNWNPQEHSWDCPCHGSRFDENGRLLDNPATGNLKHRPE